MIEHAENIFERTNELTFMEGEPYKSILNMLFYYESPETSEMEDRIVFLGELREKLINILVLYLSNKGLVSDIDYIADYLTTDPSKIFSVRDLMGGLMKYVCENSEMNLINEYLCKSKRIKEQNCYLLVKILILLNSVTSTKRDLIQSMRPSEKSVIIDPKLDCLETIISNITHFLLSVQWEIIYSGKSSSSNSSTYSNLQRKHSTNSVSSQSGKSPAYIERITSPSKNSAENLFNLLKANKRGIEYTLTEDIILHYLLNSELNGEKVFGRKTYFAILSHIMKKPEFFYEPPSNINCDLASFLIENIEHDVFGSKFVIFFKALILNIESFQINVQEKILSDISKLLMNSTFVEYLLKLDDIFDKTFSLLQEPEYLVNMPIAQRALEDILLTFLHAFMRDRQKRETMQKAFKTISGFPPAVLIETCNKFLTKLLKDPLGLDEVWYNTVQFVYFIEDASLQLGAKLGDSSFVEMFGKLIMYLDEMKMLYLWYPILSISGEVETIPGHREGGMVRIILKVLMGVILRVSLKENPFHCELALRLLKYFLYHKQTTRDKIIKALEIYGIMKSASKDLLYSPSIMPENIGISLESDGFVGIAFNPIKEQQLAKILFSNKTFVDTLIPTQNSSFVKEEILKSKDFFMSYSMRLLYTISNVIQVFIYSSYDITKYSDIDFEKYKKMEMKIIDNYKSNVLSKLIGKLFTSLFNGEKLEPQSSLKNLLKNYVQTHLGTFSGKIRTECYTGLDFFCNPHFKSTHRKSKELTSSPLKYLFQTSGSPGKGGSSSRKSDYVKSPTEKLDSSAYKNWYSTLKLIKEIFNNENATKEILTENEEQKKSKGPIAKHEIILKISSHILSYTFIKEIPRVLHSISTQELLTIDEIIQTRLWKFIPEKAQSDFAATMNKEKTERLIKIVKSLKQCNQVILSNSNIILPTRFSKENNEIMQKLRKEQKFILSEEGFLTSNKNEIEIYKIISEEYNKIMGRCILYKEQSVKALCKGINMLTRLDFSYDNIGRQMRLKKLKCPLQNKSVLHGLGYMRQFFIKKMMLINMLRNAKHKHKINLLPNKRTNQILSAVFHSVQHKKANNLYTAPCIQKTYSIYVSSIEPDNCNILPEIMPKSGGSFSTNETERVPILETFEAEIVKLDHSIFGLLEITDEGMTFTHKLKNTQNTTKYQYGPTSEISITINDGYVKHWKFEEISQIISRRYNLIPKQAVEIFTRNKKSIFIVIYPHKDKYTNLFSILRKINSGSHLSFRKPSSASSSTNIKPFIELIENPKETFNSHHFTDLWKDHKMSTLEYLLKINHFAGRSFQELSQYPVFPWIISDYVSNNFDINQPGKIRDLRKPMAAISEKKMRDGLTKYKVTEDFPDGRFQFGTHYMPGRAALAYLMRLQPYTLMIERFDSGGDSPSRHYHFTETLWKNLLNESDNNFELVPEFFFNPDLFVNLYFYI